jgi:hypothetical protein
MRTLILLAGLAACSPYHLATNGSAPPWEQLTQMRTDALDCAAQARNAVPSPVNAAVFGLSQTDADLQKAAARQTYADCLQRRGWSNITPATD